MPDPDAQNASWPALLPKSHPSLHSMEMAVSLPRDVRFTPVAPAVTQFSRITLLSVPCHRRKPADFCSAVLAVCSLGGKKRVIFSLVGMSAHPGACENGSHKDGSELGRGSRMSCESALEGESGLLSPAGPSFSCSPSLGFWPQLLTFHLQQLSVPLHYN